MKDTAIILSWKNSGQEYLREIDREDFYYIFLGLAKGYDKIGDNEISKTMIKIIPEVDKIFINKDINETQNIPFIECYINEKICILKIMRRHRIVWSILTDHCK